MSSKEVGWEDILGKAEDLHHAMMVEENVQCLQRAASTTQELFHGDEEHISPSTNLVPAEMVRMERKVM